ncbi:tyrosine-protein phosphatase [Streptomyces sp. WAC06614]|uniref:tyrosine-protein phosphatase n=1 Tax=Streptomyces sp. WAC06614 TaxID=2487416 RepID=UPI000F7932C8|nr:tyrosine-protein phosphatase [Streptomyces sp. WAC06614]RSS81161.1 tyrosine-protein phosphatase [Streptomyces sp. WAC06614]
MALKPITKRLCTAASAALVVAVGVGLLSAPTATAAGRCPTGATCGGGPQAAGGPADTGGAGGIRHIPLQGAVNFRDLGGYPTESGGEIRKGLVHRSDALGKLTADDLAEVSPLGLKKVVDFRTAEEVVYGGADRLPDGLTATSRSIGDAGLFENLGKALAGGDAAEQERVLGGGRAEGYMRKLYESFVTDPDSREQFAATLRDIAAGGQDPLLYHCTAGKDRTGWMSYVLLRALGVAQGTAEQDYLASNVYRAEADAKQREELERSGLMKNPDLMIPMQEVRQDYLNAATAQITAHYGTFDRYLKEGLGLKDQELTALKDKLVS